MLWRVGGKQAHHMSQWYRVLAPCPKCARLPALHLAQWMIDAARLANPDQPLLDFQCQNRKCHDEQGRRTTYIIAAHAVVRAEPIRMTRPAA